jgi:hypothetical protein
MDLQSLHDRPASLGDAEKWLALGAGALPRLLGHRSGASLAVSSAPLLYRGITGCWPAIVDGYFRRDDTKTVLGGDRRVRPRIDPAGTRDRLERGDTPLQYGSRAVIWTLAIVAAVLVALPLLSMLGMTACCGGMMGGEGIIGADPMAAVGVIWWLLAASFVIALIVVLVRTVTRV